MALTRGLHTEIEMLQVEGLQKGWYTSSPELLARIESIEDFDGEEPPKPKPEPEYKDTNGNTCLPVVDAVPG